MTRARISSTTRSFWAAGGRARRRAGQAIDRHGAVLSTSANALLILVFVVMAYNTIPSAAGGQSATHWMGIFNVSELRSWSAVVSYFKELHTGIPPIWSLVEIVDYRLTGNVQFFLKGLYQFSIVMAFLLAVLLGPRSLALRVLAALVSLLFISALVVIHPCNSQVYDTLFPMTFLAWLGTLTLLGRAHGRWALACAFLCGLTLGVLELTRPFVLLLMPLLGAAALYALRGHGRAALLAFMVPLLILSGGWHLKLLTFNDGQVIWSNHSGFNLQRAWDLGEGRFDYPKLLPETGLNSHAHTVNSQGIQSAIVRYAVTHPAFTARMIDTRLVTFLSPQTSLYKCTGAPQLYGPVVHLTLLWLCGGVAILAYRCWQMRSGVPLLAPQGVWLVFTVATIFLLATGEAGEEARFLISVLPLLAGLPLPIRGTAEA